MQLRMEAMESELPREVVREVVLEVTQAFDDRALLHLGISASNQPLL